MPNSLKGLASVKNHPEKRAEDLLAAFKDYSVDMILCAIGGDDILIDFCHIYLSMMN